MTALPFVLDTDFASDCDDCGDLAAATMYHRQGYGSLVGVIIDSTRAKSAGAAQAVLLSRGLSGVPIGTYQPGSTFDPNAGAQNAWTDYVYDNFDHTGVGLSASCPDSTTQYRTLLAEATTPVTIILTGFMTSLDALLYSPADGISPLTGIELVAAKVRALYSCTGIWPAGDEFNLIQAPAVSADLLTKWPATVPLIFVGIELGNAVGSTTPNTLPDTDVVYAAYNQASYLAGRTAWGQVAVAAALEREAGFKRVQGTATINASTGANAFTEGAGPHYYLLLQQPAINMQAHLQQILAVPTTGTPVTAWSGSYAPVAIVGS